MKKKRTETEPENTVIDTEATVVDTGVENVEDPSTFFDGMEMLTIVALKEPGRGIRGIYKGLGAPLILDEGGKDAHEVNTHLIQTKSGLTVRLMGATIMDSELKNIPEGNMVAILRGRTEKKGSKQLTYYQVAHKSTK
jgi:hypothetical protein